MPLNGLAHDASNNHLCSTLPNLCRQSLGGSSLSCGLAVSQQWHFLRGQNQSCHPPFAVLPVFPKEKEVQTCVRSWRHLPAPLWTPLWPWKKQLKSIMWAHSLDVSQWLPDWGSNNARRMADSFMPAESNALWSCHLAQKAGGVGSPAGTWLKRLGEMRGDSVLLWASPTSTTSLFSKSFHSSVVAIVPHAWCIIIPATLMAWDSHTASPSSSWHWNEHLAWLQEEKNSVQLGHPCASNVQDDAA